MKIATWYAGVTVDAKNNLFGTARYGGSQSNAGTVYELKLTGRSCKERLVHSFGTTGDGSQTLAGVTLFKERAEKRILALLDSG